MEVVSTNCLPDGFFASGIGIGFDGDKDASAPTFHSDDTKGQIAEIASPGRPFFSPMFDQIDESFDERKMKLDYFVMGQVCVAKPYRGRGVFYKLYETMYSCMHPYFDACITEVDPLNPRSIRAHYKAGFELFERYTDPSGRPWELIIWYWKE